MATVHSYVSLPEGIYFGPKVGICFHLNHREDLLSWVAIDALSNTFHLQAIAQHIGYVANKKSEMD